MENFEQNENVVNNVTQGVEFVPDRALVFGWKVYYRAFKDWSWNLAWRNKYTWRFFLISLITGWIWMVAGIFDSYFSSLIWMEDWYSLSLFRNIVNFVLWIGLLWFSLNIANWLRQQIDDFFHEINRGRIWKSFVWSLLYWLAVFGWSLLLLIPWIIFSVRFQFFAYAIIDKWLWPVEALKYSWRMTKWRFWEIVWFDFYFVLINILWILCLFIWVIWTWAMTNMASARYYRLLSNIYDRNWINNNTVYVDAHIVMQDEPDFYVQQVNSNINNVNWSVATSKNVIWNNVNMNNANWNGVDLKNINVDELTPIGAIERPKHDSNLGNL